MNFTKVKKYFGRKRKIKINIISYLETLDPNNNCVPTARMLARYSQLK